MAVRKRRVRRVKTSFFALVFCLFTFVIYLFSSLFLRTYNVSLSRSLQTCNAEITSYQRENAAIALQIQQLSTYDRVLASVEGEDMSVMEENIVTIDPER